MRDPWYEAEIEDYPQAEQGKAQVDAPHASGKTGDRVGDAHIERRGDLPAVSSPSPLFACCALGSRPAPEALATAWSARALDVFPDPWKIRKYCVLLGPFWFQNAPGALRRNLIGKTQVPRRGCLSSVNPIRITITDADHCREWGARRASASTRIAPRRAWIAL
jgi:hypothetical protein